MQFPDASPIYSKQSSQQLIKVSQIDDLRLLTTDQLTIQSAIMLNEPQRLVLPYMQSMMATLLFQRPPESVLLLGLGGGDMVRYLHHYLPETDITAIENDPAIVRIATDYFKLPMSNSIQVCISDAMQYIKTDEHRVDTLFVDLYTDDGLPEILKNDSFYNKCRKRLNPGGVLVTNLIVKDEDDFKQILWTIRQNFERLTLCMTVPEHSNILVFAFQSRPTDIQHDALMQKAKSLSADYGLKFIDYVKNQFTNNPLENGELIL